MRLPGVWPSIWTKAGFDPWRIFGGQGSGLGRTEGPTELPAVGLLRGSTRTLCTWARPAAPRPWWRAGLCAPSGGGACSGLSQSVRPAGSRGMHGSHALLGTPENSTGPRNHLACLSLPQKMEEAACERRGSSPKPCRALPSCLPSCLPACGDHQEGLGRDRAGIQGGGAAPRHCLRSLGLTQLLSGRWQPSALGMEQPRWPLLWFANGRMSCVCVPSAGHGAETTEAPGRAHRRPGRSRW